MLDLQKFVTLLRANLRLIVLISGGILALAVTITLLQTPRYTAETTIQINNQSAQVLGKDEDISQSEASSPLDTERFLQTQMDIVNSRALAERVVSRLHLLGNKSFYEGMAVAAPDASDTPAEVKEFTLTVLRKGQGSNLPRNSRLASISFTSTDPALSARVANAWASEVIQANLQRRYDSSSYARDFIAGQLDQAKAKLEKSELDLNSYARSAGLLRARDPSVNAANDPGAGGANAVTSASLLQLNTAANEAKTARIAAEQRYNLLKSNDLLSSPDVLANQAVTGLLSDRAKLEADLQRERAKHLDDYPTILQFKAQLAAINKQIDQVAQSIRNSVRQQYESAVQAEKSLDSQVKLLQGSSLAEQDRAVTYNLLARDSYTNRTLYEGLLQRYKELNAAAGISASNITIIDQADTPTKPSSPSLIRNVAVAIFLAGLISGSVIFLREQFDDAIRVPEEVEGKLGLSLLGVIPKLELSNPIEELADPKSTLSEAYNSLSSALRYSTPNGLPRSLMITSSQPSEGKSTSSIAIAYIFARIGRKVVLVDMDLRRPTLHRYVGSNKLGVSSLLTSQNTLDEVLQPTELTNLSAITSGPIPPNPTELLNSPGLLAMLEELKGRFDLVILDSPPVLGLADAPIISALADGVLIVVQSERCRRRALRTSLQRLAAVRANILGATLTMFDVSKVSNQYSEYYGYNYYTYSSTTPD
nr:polysaccharide biosynthesis tyrosine autokinase [Novosphingobium sp. FKTRR1]